ncbi:MAG: DNA topoisomerase IB, partial [Mesorhizobium sp.]
MLQRPQSSPDRSAGEDETRKNGAQDSAERASLTYVSDADPGIRRKRKGKGFAYLGLQGRSVSAATLARIKA